MLHSTEKFVTAIWTSTPLSEAGKATCNREEHTAAEAREVLEKIDRYKRNSRLGVKTINTLHRLFFDRTSQKPPQFVFFLALVI